MEQFVTAAFSNIAGKWTDIQCTFCGWRIGACGNASIIRDLYPLRDKHAETCRENHQAPAPARLCGNDMCVRCYPHSDSQEAITK